MSNAIYIINDLPEDADFANPGYKDMAWVPHCLGSIRKYADRIGAELISVNMDSILGRLGPASFGRLHLCGNGRLVVNTPRQTLTERRRRPTRQTARNDEQIRK